MLDLSLQHLGRLAQKVSVPSQRNIFFTGVLAVYVVAHLLLTPVSFAKTLDGERFSFNMPAQSLREALIALSKQSGVRLIYQSKIVERLKAPALTEELSVQQALQLLLADSNLSFHFIDAQHVAIKAPKKGKLDAKISSQQTTVISGVEHRYIPEVLVMGETNYQSCCDNITSAATKMNIPTIEVPRSLEGIDRKTFRDRGNILLNEAFRDYTSVLVLDQQGNINIRGFNVPHSAVLVDGMPTISRGIMSSPLQNIDGIEIAKGVNSTLYGHGQPGGLVNLVTKKPMPNAFNHMGVSYGNYDRYLSFDINQPLSGNVLFRLNGLARKEREYKTYNGEAEQMQLHPSFTYKFSEKTTLGIALDYETQELQGRVGERPIIGERYILELLHSEEALARLNQHDYFPVNGPDDRQPKKATIYGARINFDSVIDEVWEHSLSLAFSRSEEAARYRANWNGPAMFLHDPQPDDLLSDPVKIPYSLLKDFYMRNTESSNANIFYLDQFHNYLSANYPSLIPDPPTGDQWMDVIMENGTNLPFWLDGKIHQYQQSLEDDNDARLFNAQWNLRGEFNWFNSEHHVLLGMSYMRQHDQLVSYQYYSGDLRQLGLDIEQGGDVILGWHVQRYAMAAWFNPFEQPVNDDIFVAPYHCIGHR